MTRRLIFNAVGLIIFHDGCIIPPLAAVNVIASLKEKRASRVYVCV